MSAGVSPWGLKWGCRGGFSITKDSSPDITCFFTPARPFGYVAVPTVSLLYVADLFVLSSVILPWRSYSVGLPVLLSRGGSLLKGWLQQE